MIPAWAYLAIPAGGLALWAVVRWRKPAELGSAVRPLDEAVADTARLAAEALTARGHHLAFEYINPQAIAGGCPVCGGSLIITASDGDAEIHGNACLLRACQTPRLVENLEPL